MSKKVKEIELRHKELEHEQHAREHELQLKEQEIIQERERREREREREQHELKLAQEREREREHELKLAQVTADKELEVLKLNKELELKRIDAGIFKDVKPGNANAGHDRSPRAPAFRFNSFNEKTDDLDSWFATFESQCEIFEVSDNDKKAHLIGLFSGKYRDTLTSLADK